MYFKRKKISSINNLLYFLVSLLRKKKSVLLQFYIPEAILRQISGERKNVDLADRSNLGRRICSFKFSHVIEKKYSIFYFANIYKL